MTHAKNVWLPKTLNCLRDDDKFILDLMDSLASSLSLLVFIFFYEKNNAPASTHVMYTAEYANSLNTAYFEPLVHTLEAGISSLDD